MQDARDAGGKMQDAQPAIHLSIDRSIHQAPTRGDSATAAGAAARRPLAPHAPPQHDHTQHFQALNTEQFLTRMGAPNQTRCLSTPPCPKNPECLCRLRTHTVHCSVLLSLFAHSTLLLLLAL
jgi:hypothetical protein